MFDSVKKSVKGRVPAGWRGPGAFGTEWVGIGLRRMVMKVFEESPTAAKFIEISSNFSPVNVTWSGTKGKTPCKQLRLVMSKSDSTSVDNSVGV